jgi:hypothetical protein
VVVGIAAVGIAAVGIMTCTRPAQNINGSMIAPANLSWSDADVQPTGYQGVYQLAKWGVTRRYATSISPICHRGIHSSQDGHRAAMGSRTKTVLCHSLSYVSEGTCSQSPCQLKIRKIDE